MNELYITIPDTLPKKPLSIINQIIQSVCGLSFTGEQANSVAINNPTYFNAVYEFLKLVEGVSSTTYPDTTGHLSIGIGFNLDQAGADTIINSMGLNYADLSTLPAGKPLGGITDVQIATLLRYSLLGFAGFTGKAQILKSILDGAGLSNHVFKAYELIALQSMAFDNAGLIGSKLLAAISANNELEAMVQIVEYSNKAQNPGISNRMLETGGLFHGNPSEVHLPWRTYEAIKQAVSPTPLILIGGPPIYALPYGNEEVTYKGSTAPIKVIPGGDDAGLDTITYGTSGADTFPAITTGSPVVFGGDSDDAMIVTGSSFSYLAGNQGTDTYSINTAGSTGSVFIIDSDGTGKLFLNGIPVWNILTPQGTLQLGGTNYQFTLDSTGTLTINWGDATKNIYIYNFKWGQFGIILPLPTVSISTPLPGSFFEFPSPPQMGPVGSDGYTITYPYAGHAEAIDTTTLNKMGIVKTADVAGTPCTNPLPCGTEVYVVLPSTKLSGGNSVTAWIKYDNGGPNPTVGKYVRVSDSNGNLVASSKIPGADTYWGWSDQPAVSSLGNNRFLVTYAAFTDANIYGVVFDGNAQVVTGPVVLATTAVAGLLQAQKLDCSADTCFLSWVESDATLPITTLRGKIFDSNLTSTSGQFTIDVSPFPGYPLGTTFFSFVSQVTGKCLSIYAHFPDAMTQVASLYVQPFDVQGNKLGAARFIGTSTFDSLYFGNYLAPCSWATSIGTDYAFVAWPNSDGSVYGQYIDGNGDLAGSSFSYGNGALASVSATGDGGTAIGISFANAQTLSILTFDTSGMRSAALPQTPSTAAPSAQACIIAPTPAPTPVVKTSPPATVTPVISASDRLKPSAMYAPLIGLLDATTRVIKTVARTYQTHVFFKPKSNAQKGDFETTRCMPVGFYGEPSVVCKGEGEGQEFSMIYTPKSPQRFFEGLDGQIMLGAVVVNWIKNWWKGSPKKDFPSMYVNKKEVEARLSAYEERLERMKTNLKDKDFLWSIEEYKEEIGDLKRKKHVRANELVTLKKDIRYLQKNIVKEKNRNIKIAVSKSSPPQSYEWCRFYMKSQQAVILVRPCTANTIRHR